MREGIDFKTITTFFNTRSQYTKLLIYLIGVLFFVWISIDVVKWNWADDPIQKIVLAPLSEEPLKLLLSFYFCYVVLLFTHISKIKKTDFPEIFMMCFIPAGMISGLLLGLIEGPFNNIISHFSMTSIAAILLVSFYIHVKNKSWRVSKKILFMYTGLIPSMILHSIHNQYSNIGFVRNHPEFEYLVCVARYLQDHTFLKTQSLFTMFEFVLAFFVLIIWFIVSVKYREKH